MTAYNREKYIAEAIESVLASTYTNFELIIVDDNSNDETYTIAAMYAQKDGRIRLFKNEHNLGDYPNRNRAASYACGKYLKYLDSDDLLHPNGLQLLKASMESFPEAGLGFGIAHQGFKQVVPCVLSPKEAYTFHFFGPGLLHKGPLEAIIKTQVFKDVGGFETGRMVSDIDLWHRIALHYPVVLIPSEIGWQRRHESQELSEENKYVFEGEKIKWKYLLQPACGLSACQLKKIRAKRLQRYAGFIVSGVFRRNKQQIKNYLQCLKYVMKIRIA